MPCARSASTSSSSCTEVSEPDSRYRNPPSRVERPVRHCPSCDIKVFFNDASSTHPTFVEGCVCHSPTRTPEPSTQIPAWFFGLRPPGAHDVAYPNSCCGDRRSPHVGHERRRRRRRVRHRATPSRHRHRNHRHGRGAECEDVRELPRAAGHPRNRRALSYGVPALLVERREHRSAHRRTAQPKLDGEHVESRRFARFGPSGTGFRACQPRSGPEHCELVLLD